MKHEERFKAMLSVSLRKYRAFWVNIPDTKMITKENRSYHREDKRPFDGVIIAPNFVLCVELKYMYNGLKEHQLQMGRDIEDTNNMYVVLRMVENKQWTAYRAETTDKQILFESDDIADFTYKLITHYS
jgi:hypothetical protein